MADAEDPFVQCRNVTPLQRIDTAMEVFEVVKALRKQAKGSRAGQPASCGPDLRSLLAEKIERFADAWLSVGTPIDLQELEYLAGRLMELVEDPDSSIWLPESEWPEYVSKVFNGVANAELKLRDIAINVWRTDAEWLHRWLWRTVDGEELTDFPDAAAEVSEVSAADEEANAPAAPEAGGEFAGATDAVPAVEWSRLRTPKEWRGELKEAGNKRCERWWSNIRKREASRIDGTKRWCRITRDLAEEWKLKLPEFES